jgi:hypothetical protein
MFVMYICNLVAFIILAVGGVGILTRGVRIQGFFCIVLACLIIMMGYRAAEASIKLDCYKSHPGTYLTACPVA